jgi:hypothetical protein
MLAERSSNKDRRAEPAVLADRVSRGFGPWYNPHIGLADLAAE